MKINMGIEGAKVKKLLRFFTKNELYEIHLATLEILESIGIEFHDDNALKILDEGGAEVDYKTKQVKFPQYLIKEAIRNNPNTITLCGRYPEYDVKLENGKVYFASGANALYILDKDKGIRDALIEDCIKLARIADALENIHVYLTLVSPLDAPPTGVDRIRCAIALKNTCKHFFHDAQGKEGALDQIKIASIIVGGEEELRKRPIISLAPCITSPFRWGKDAIEVLMVMSEKNLPHIISSEPMSGATSPVTLAGSIVQQNAEILSGLVLSKLINKRSPAILCTLPSIMDMKTGNISMGCIELALMCGGMAQLMQYYNIPYVGSGGISDSKLMDEQAAYEKALTLLIPALAGTNLIHLSSGMLESILTLSYEQVVIDNEIIGMVLRALKGIEVNSETLAIDVIKSVGAGKHYLKHKHTLKNLRKEHFIPEISDRLARKTWLNMGAKDAIDKAKEKIEKILSTHQIKPLDKDIEKEIDNTLNQIMKKLLS